MNIKAVDFTVEVANKVFVVRVPVELVFDLDRERLQAAVEYLVAEEFRRKKVAWNAI